MSFIKPKTFIKKTVLFIAFSHLLQGVFAQNTDSTKTESHFAGTITATNNGVSLLPNFSLGKPAALFDLSVGKGKLSFDPMFRFGMDGKPWAFVFWWRYKIVTQPRFSMGIGAHPSFVFRSVPITTNGTTTDYLTTQRFFAWEATPTYFLNKKISVGVYYLGAHGLTKELTQYTTFLAFKSVISNLSLPKHFNLTFIPQFYYLQMDAKKGTYATATVSLSKKNVPISISSIVSQAIETEISGNTFVWNVALNYNFNKKYVSKS